MQSNVKISEFLNVAKNNDFYVKFSKTKIDFAKQVHKNTEF